MFQIVTSPPFLGLNEDENPSDLNPGELTKALNVWRRGSALGTRPGTAYESSSEEWDATLTDSGGSSHAGTACQGLVDVADDFDTTQFLLGMFDGNVFHDRDVSVSNNPLDKTANSVQITAGAANWWTFALGRGSGSVKLYGVGGKQTATVDDFWSWDLTPANALVDVGGGSGWAGTWPGARYILEWRNRGFICGMRGTGTDDNPMVVRYSALGDMDQWPASNVIGGAFAIGGFGSEGANYTTGLASYRDNRNSFLIILTRQKLISLTETGNPFIPLQFNDEIANGCVSQRAYVSLGTDAGDAIYLSERGIHSLRQSQRFGERAESFISYKIRRTFDTINRSQLENAVGAYDAHNNLVVFAVPTGSNTQNDTILALDLRDADSEDGITAETARWYIWRMAGTNHRLADLIAARDRSSGSDSRKFFLYGGNYKGDVFRFQQTDFRDLGEAYSIEMAGHHSDAGAPGVEKVYGDTHLWIGPTANYNPLFRLDFDIGSQTGDAQSIDLTGGEAVWNTAKFDEDQFATEGVLSLRRKRLYSVGSGETARWRITHNGANEPVYLSRMTQEVDSQGDELGNVDAA